MSKHLNSSQIFAANLKRLRSRTRLTQEKLAEKCDLHWRYLQKLESGDANPSLNVLLAVKKGLRCSWDGLLGR